MKVGNYVLTFPIKPQPINALRQLDDASKDKITPVVLLAPWLATTPLSSAIEKFEEAFGCRRYFLDISMLPRSSGTNNEATQQHNVLKKDPTKIWGFIREFENSLPCFHIREDNAEYLKSSIELSRELGRGFCLKIDSSIRLSGVPLWFTEFAEKNELIDTADWVLVIEYGWISNALNVLSHAYNILSVLGDILKPSIQTVISCTTFPTDFREFSMRQTEERDEFSKVGSNAIETPIAHSFTNRYLINELKKATNIPNLIYGDWGSTRPPRLGMASTPKNRIDYPIRDQWVFARLKDENISFDKAANIIRSSDYWHGNLGCWGENLIDATAENGTGSIDSMPKMNAARINIHIFLQANYARYPSADELDVPWVD